MEVVSSDHGRDGGSGDCWAGAKEWSTRYRDGRSKTVQASQGEGARQVKPATTVRSSKVGRERRRNKLWIAAVAFEARAATRCRFGPIVPTFAHIGSSSHC